LARLVALAAACAERGIDASVTSTDDGQHLVRTAFRADLVELARTWSRPGPGKSVPDRFVFNGVTLRLWALVAGRWSESGYLLGLDPDGPRTHRPLVTALVRAGLCRRPCWPRRTADPRYGCPVAVGWPGSSSWSAPRRRAFPGMIGRPCCRLAPRSGRDRRWPIGNWGIPAAVRVK